jgi:hypothetical protein
MKRDLWIEIVESGWIREKCANDVYAQNLYAAFSNMRWIVANSYEILKDEYWSCSWRSAGGLIAELRNCGEDYMDWYASGMGAFAELQEGFVGEGEVTDEIKEDLGKLGWIPYPWPEKDLI